MKPKPGSPWCNGVREPPMQMANATSGRNGYGQLTPPAPRPQQQEQMGFMLNTSSGRNGFLFTQPAPPQPAPRQPASPFGFPQSAPAGFPQPTPANTNGLFQPTPTSTIGVPQPASNQPATFVFPQPGPPQTLDASSFPQPTPAKIWVAQQQPTPTQSANTIGFLQAAPLTQSARFPQPSPTNTIGFPQPAQTTQSANVFMPNQASGSIVSSATTVVTHNGVTCDGGCSRGPLTGVRYKCSTCANYDLCESCMVVHDKPGRTLPQECMISHPRNHYFLRIPHDVGASPPPMLVNRSNWVHHNISCAECNTPDIVGYRYFCTTCGTSFCESCEQQGLPRTTAAGVHLWSHNLLKMVPPPAPASVTPPAATTAPANPWR